MSKLCIITSLLLLHLHFVLCLVFDWSRAYELFDPGVPVFHSPLKQCFMASFSENGERKFFKEQVADVIWPLLRLNKLRNDPQKVAEAVKREFQQFGHEEVGIEATKVTLLVLMLFGIPPLNHFTSEKEKNIWTEKIWNKKWTDQKECRKKPAKLTMTTEGVKNLLANFGKEVLHWDYKRIGTKSWWLVGRTDQQKFYGLLTQCLCVIK